MDLRKELLARERECAERACAADKAVCTAQTATAITLRAEQEARRRACAAKNELAAAKAALVALPEPPAPKPCPRKVGRHYRIRVIPDEPCHECVLSQLREEDHRLLLVVINGAASGLCIAPVRRVENIWKITDDEWRDITGGCECEPVETKEKQP